MGSPGRLKGPREARAFTLIELMVVITIIAILAAILFPVFARAREKARQARCASNLLNIGIALRVYGTEHCGHLPPTNNDLWPLVPACLPDPEVLQCPSVGRLLGLKPDWVPPGRRRQPAGRESDYVYRGGLCDDEDPRLTIVGDDVSDRHNDGAGYLFLDGHVKWLSGADTWRAAEPGLPELRALGVPPPAPHDPQGERKGDD